MTTDERLEQLEALMREGFQEMRQRMDRQDHYLAEFRSAMIQRFEQLESRMDMLTITVQSLDSRVPALTKAMLELQVRMGKLERPAA